MPMFLLFFLVGLFIVIMCIEDARNGFLALLSAVTQIGIVVFIITAIGFVAVAALIFGVSFLAN